MEVFASNKVLGAFTDPTLIHNLTHVARQVGAVPRECCPPFRPPMPHRARVKMLQLHDSIDFLSFDDERRQLAVLISAFIRKVKTEALH